MNPDILAGKWKQMRGQVKQWWGKLTDDDLDRIDGAMDKLAGEPVSGSRTQQERAVIRTARSLVWKRLEARPRRRTPKRRASWPWPAPRGARS